MSPSAGTRSPGEPDAFLRCGAQSSGYCVASGRKGRWRGIRTRIARRLPKIAKIAKIARAARGAIFGTETGTGGWQRKGEPRWPGPVRTMSPAWPGPAQTLGAPGRGRVADLGDEGVGDAAVGLAPSAGGAVHRPDRAGHVGVAGVSARNPQAAGSPAAARFSAGGGIPAARPQRRRRCQQGGEAWAAGGLQGMSFRCEGVASRRPSPVSGKAPWQEKSGRKNPPGGPGGHPPGLPQIRTCVIHAYGSSSHGFATCRYTE
jgi:hypothetical protein